MPTWCDLYERDAAGLFVFSSFLVTDLAKILRPETTQAEDMGLSFTQGFLFSPQNGHTSGEVVLVLSTGVPHSGIMRRPQQGAASVVGELTCTAESRRYSPNHSKEWGGGVRG